jgi:hypothetical protein
MTPDCQFGLLGGDSLEVMDRGYLHAAVWAHNIHMNT